MHIACRRWRSLCAPRAWRGGRACSQRCLKSSAVSLGADYIAFVGSRRKFGTLSERLIADGIDASALAAVKAPAGLDIKAITPDEIALSILAEIIEHRRTRQRPEAAK